MMCTIQNLDDFIRSDYFHAYEESWYSGLGCAPWTQDIATRVHEAAEHGADGRTHGEVIDLWREALDAAWRDDEIPDEIYDGIYKEITDCEEWHYANGTIEETIG